jgi:lipopolysaccharide export system permease protein
MIKNDVQVSLVFQYFLCLIPLIIYQVSPLGVLLCTFITIGIFVRHNEITALKAHGISLFRVLKVFLLISGCLFLLSIWLQEYVLPYTIMHVKEIKNVHIKGKKGIELLKNPFFWYRSKNEIYNIDFFDPEKNMLQNITIFYFGPNVSLNKRIDAKNAYWIDNAWVFHEGIIREFKPDGDMTLKKFTKMAISIDKTPEDFKMSRKEGDEMSFSQIKRFIKMTKKEGYHSTPYEVEMHAKIAYPFINVIMGLLGIPFALRIGRSGGMALGISISIAFAFMYWIFFAFCVSLGKGGSIPPFVSVWIANAAFGFLGTYLFLHVRQ